MKTMSRFVALSFLSALAFSLIAIKPVWAETINCPMAEAYCDYMARDSDGNFYQEDYDACMIENCYPENTPSPNVPEMSDFLAGAFVVVAGATIYFIRKRRTNAAA